MSKTRVVMVRGTHGSGKSTIVKGVRDASDHYEVLMQEGRRQPSGYVCFSKVAERWASVLFIPGHYETPCGGCDTISTMSGIFDRVREMSSTYNVLFEGAIAQTTVKRFLELRRPEVELVAIRLTTTLEEAIESVKKRRLAKGNEKPLDPSNVQAKHETELRAIQRIRSAGGITVYEMSRREAADWCLSLLRR